MSDMMISVIVVVMFCLGFSMGYYSALPALPDKKTKRTGRMGVITFSGEKTQFGKPTGHEFNVQVMIREVEKLNGFSKIEVLSISGIDSSSHDDVRSHVGEYVLEEKIKWLEGENEYDSKS